MYGIQIKSNEKTVPLLGEDRVGPVAWVPNLRGGGGQVGAQGPQAPAQGELQTQRQGICQVLAYNEYCFLKERNPVNC